jgi:tetratricopeptide (TPR) repeat protein
MKLKLVFLFFTQICISQTIEIDKLMKEGEKAYSDNNFLLAKEIYLKATNISPKDRNCWYNLAASELKLGEKEKACEYFYQAFLLNDREVLITIKENCPNFRNGQIMSINDVEEKPKFIYKEKEYLFFEKNLINTKYLEILKNKFRYSKTLTQNFEGRLYIRFKITANDSLDIQINGFIGDEKKTETIKREINFILKNMVTYVSAKNKGMHVDLWEDWSIPVTF